MPKRRADGSLTGGSGDTNPQWLRITRTAAPLTTFASDSFALPVSKLADPSRPTIMEILQVKWVMNGTLAIVAGTNSTYRNYLMTRNPATTEPASNDGAIVDLFKFAVASVAASTASFSSEGIWQHDLTDDAGHGILVATDNIFMGDIATNATSPFSSAFTCHIKYRLKRVGLAEYIGILQSQQ